MPIGKMYEYQADESNRICYVYAIGGKYLGHVWLDKTNAWSVSYASSDVNRLPINSALTVLGYKADGLPKELE